MPTQEASCHCPTHGNVLGRREAPNHVVHALISIFTCGLWLIVWALVTLSVGEYACPICGNKATER